MVEIHVRSAEWYRHKHHLDAAYQEVILHVVWADDQPVFNQNGRIIPTLILKGRVAPDLILRHRRLQTANFKVPCHGQISARHLPRLSPMLKQAVINRLERRRKKLAKILSQSHGDWDLLYYRTLGRNFGFRINSEVFEELTRITPLEVIRKLSSCFQLEAIYFGQAGMLEKELACRYYRALKKEYQYLRKKFISLPTSHLTNRWKFLRMRPPNFPTLRIAQFAAFVHHYGLRFGHFRDMTNWNQLDEFLNFAVSNYWRTHYHFSRPTTAKNPGLGKASKLSIALNSLVPLQMVYLYNTSRSLALDATMELLRSMPPENNRLIASWHKVGFKALSGLDTQALIALNEQYCSTKICLTCTLGKSLVRESQK